METRVFCLVDLSIGVSGVLKSRVLKLKVCFLSIVKCKIHIEQCIKCMPIVEQSVKELLFYISFVLLLFNIM